MIFLKPDKENPTVSYQFPHYCRSIHFVTCFEQPNVSIFQNSVYGSHFVGPATASLIQPFSK